jgi:hypothetical protein
MCDLWKHTLDERVPDGAIPAQIDYALARLPAAPHLKLYNSGNFFDAQAIPPADHAAIAERVRSFQTVIVENHPLLCGRSCIEFRDRIETKLEVALGLETAHPDVLQRLNKRMTLEDFQRAAQFLRGHDIAMRAFILLRPPYLSEAEGVEWALRSLEFAFSLDVGCCSVIPTRAGNGMLEQLQTQGTFSPPSLAALEEVQDRGIEMRQGRVFADLWNIEQSLPCPRCGPARVERLRRMNFSQTVEPRIACDCASGS